jgi:hypothetical protein
VRAAGTATRAVADACDGLAVLVGLASVLFSALYFASDLIELAQGGFSTPQLAITYAAEAAIPLFVVGLYVVQRPRIGRLGLVGAVAYAYSFVFFASTVVFALVSGAKDWKALDAQLGWWMTIHGGVMVIGGLAFGLAVVRAGALPRWTGAALMAGVVLVAASSALPAIAQTASAGVRDLAFAGMGSSLIIAGQRRRPSRVQALAVAQTDGARVGIGVGRS